MNKRGTVNEVLFIKACMVLNNQLDLSNNECVIPAYFKDLGTKFKYRYSLFLNTHDIKVY